MSSYIKWPSSYRGKLVLAVLIYKTLGPILEASQGVVTPPLVPYFPVHVELSS